MKFYGGACFRVHVRLVCSGNCANRRIEMEKRKAAARLLLAVCEVVKELGPVPSGEVYVHILGVIGISPSEWPTYSLEEYTHLINALRMSGMVRQDPSFLLHWTGTEEKLEILRRVAT